MNLRIERLGQGERIAAGSALALFACMFLSWFNFSYTASNAWESLHYISPILAISIVATLGVALAEVREFDIGDIPGGLVVFVLGCVSALLILFRLIDPISTPGIEGGSTSGSVEAGAFLGFFAALGIAAGGYITTDGKAVDRLKALMPSGSSASSFPSAPPPAPGPHPQPPSPAPPPPTPERPAASSGDSDEPARSVLPPATAPEPPVASEESAKVEFPAAAAEAESPAESGSPAEDDSPATGVAEKVEEAPRSVFCEGCGAPLRPQDRFCRKCGHQQAQVVAGR